MLRVGWVFVVPYEGYAGDLKMGLDRPRSIMGTEMVVLQSSSVDFVFQIYSRF